MKTLVICLGILLAVSIYFSFALLRRIERLETKAAELKFLYDEQKTFSMHMSQSQGFILRTLTDMQKAKESTLP